MGWLRKRLSALEKKNTITIPQQDGTVRKFPESALRDAYLNLMQRLRSESEEDAPPEHPLLEAARNSSDPFWTQSAWAKEVDPSEPVPHLYEDA
jgi:hypothetical protein